jgi:hypothetical protein
MQNTPKILIGYGSFLQPMFTEYWRAEQKDLNWQPLTRDEIFDRVKAYIKVWKPFEEKVINGLIGATNLHFAENLVSVFVISGYYGGFSDPVVISSDVPEERFVNLLSHELTHRLLTFNEEDISAGYIFDKMFSDILDAKTRNHIIVHAILQYLYIDVLNDQERLDKDIQYYKDYKGYREAWDIVLERGYKQLLDEYKDHYPEARGKAIKF